MFVASLAHALLLRRSSACCMFLLLSCVGAASAEGDYDPATQNHGFASLSSATYGIIIDAGSSGSRLRMYKIGDGEVSAIFPKSEDEDSFETEPGLSSHPAGPASLQGMLDAAKRCIPAEEHPRTVLWVKATAGLRIIDRQVLEVTFNRLDRYLRKSCPFQYISSEVIGGEQEALLAYISINYLKGSLFEEPNERVGILDMGGASLQIAHNPLKFVLAESHSFYVRGERRTVYATSQIKFGLDTAIQRAFDLFALEHEKTQATSLSFPCFNQGIEVVAEVFGRNITFVGTGDNVACMNVTNRLLHRDYDCLMPPCPFMGLHMDPFVEAKRFYAISNFFYIANGLGLLGWDEERALTPGQIRKAAEELCETPGEVAKAQGSQWKYRINHCFGGHYMANILEAYGFRLDDDNVVFLRKIMGQAADWSLGAILYETRAMPLFSPRLDGQSCNSTPELGLENVTRLEVDVADSSSGAAGKGPALRR